MKKSKWGLWIVLLFTFTSCGGYYRMTSRVNRDGSMVREVYATADSAFMDGPELLWNCLLIPFQCSE